MYKISASSFAKLIPKQVKCLEIGPYNNPYLFGNNVKYFDIYTTQQIKELNPTHKNIPNINFHSPIGDLSAVSESFGIIFSSHVVEHQPDLIKHLQDIDKLLQQAGKYFLVIPDKRYSFDYFFNESLPHQVITAHLEHRKLHSLENIIANRHFLAHNNPRKHFLGCHGIQHLNNGLSSQINNTFLELHNLEHYKDCHAWYFTPKSFKQIINQLNQIGYINLKVEKIYPTFPGKLEFYAILSKS